MTLIAVSSILLVSFGGSEMVFAQQTTATMILEQPNLPTITFTNGTVDVVLDDTGRGYVEFALIGEPTIVLENKALSDVVTFEFPPGSDFFPRNPRGLDRITDNITFQIAEGFAPNRHILLYNITHLTFQLTNPGFYW